MSEINRKKSEKDLHIPGDYQYKALNNNFYVQRNWHKNKLDVFDLLNIKTSGWVVADVGCGSGNFAYRNFNKFKKIIALDFNKPALEFVQSKSRELGIQNVETHYYDLMGNSGCEFPPADLLVCTEVLEHFTPHDLDNTVINNIKEMLKKDGLFFVTTPNSASLWPVLERFLDATKLVPHLSGEQHFSAFTTKELKDLLHKHGFQTLETGTFNHFSPYVPSGTLRKVLLSMEKKFFKHHGPIIYLLAKKL